MGNSRVQIQNAEKQEPPYRHEAEAQANLGQGYVGYYQDNGGNFLRLKQVKRGRTWAVGKPNDTVVKVVDARQLHLPRFEDLVVRGVTFV